MGQAAPMQSILTAPPANATAEETLRPQTAGPDTAKPSSYRPKRRMSNIEQGTAELRSDGTWEYYFDIRHSLFDILLFVASGLTVFRSTVVI
jgi:hypothetical protein